MELKKLLSPYLRAEINDYEENKISEYLLRTDRDNPNTFSRLSLPGRDVSERYNEGNRIKVYLGYKGIEEHVIFTGYIKDSYAESGNIVLLLEEGSSDFWRKDITLSYRKEKASVILGAILDSAGIDEKDITCPDIELDRFSSLCASPSRIIHCLIKTLKQYGFDKEIRYFFDSKGVFRFGTLDDDGVNPGKPYSYKTGTNIIRKSRRYIETFALPLRHSQKILIDNEEVIVQRTILKVSPRRSRLGIYYAEACH